MIRKRFENILHNPLVYIWICIFIDILNLSILNPFLPQIMLNMGGNLKQVGFVFSINALLGLFSNLLWGSLADRIGRKPVLLICRTGTFAGFLVLTFAKSIPTIFVARIIDGIFSRMEPLALTMIGDLVPFEERSKEMSRIGAGWIIGGLIGPIIGAFIADKGITNLAITLGILVLVTIFITYFGINETLPSKMTYQKDISVQNNNQTIINTLQLLKQPIPRSLILQSLFSKLPYFSFSMTASIFMGNQLGLSMQQIGTLLSAINLSNLIIRTLLFLPMLKKIGDAHIMKLGFVFYITGFLWLAFTRNIWEFFIISLILSFATSCSADVMIGLISKSVKKNEMGGMLGMNSAMESFSLIIGPILGNSLLSSTFPYGYGLIFAGFSALSLIANIFTPKYKKQST